MPDPAWMCDWFTVVCRDDAMRNKSWDLIVLVAPLRGTRRGHSTFQVPCRRHNVELNILFATFGWQRAEQTVADRRTTEAALTVGLGFVT